MARHLVSSASFSRSYSCNGYLSSGKSAFGQSNVGISNFCIGWEYVTDSVPKIDGHTQKFRFDSCHKVYS